MADVKSLERMVRDLFTERFKEISVNRVSIKPDLDDDGDHVLRVMIVLETDKPLDGRKLVGLVRHLRSRLAEQDTDDFPLISFVSKSEISKMNLETA